jgi:4-hydroxybenzoate polyprenyltransferase/phosphoserine phosphatase
MNLPIVVDLDGTLTPTDTLVESLLKYMRKSPLNLFRVVGLGRQERAVFKSHIADHTSISGELLPYNEPFLKYLKEEKAKGRRIVLATAAHRSIADAVSSHLDIFDDVLATDGTHNLKGKEKLAAIHESLGEHFVYAGNSRADIPIWKECKHAILVGVPSQVARSIKRQVSVEREFKWPAPDLKVLMKALRVHQWLKNLLLFVPLLTAINLSSFSRLLHVMVAFVAFSLAASSTYIFNDLLDIENDRAHPRKCNRPFASGQLSITAGVIMSVVLMVVAVTMALSLSQGFFFMLLLYVIMTVFYTLVLKEIVLIDVLMLSLLYTWRILAGSIATPVATSFWLMAFSVFIFFSLALVKRCAELVAMDEKGKMGTYGRDYWVEDLRVLWPLGVGAALAAVVMFGLFISAPETRIGYATPDMLWLVAIALIYWQSRLWVMTSRGQMHDDPVIFAITDKGSQIIVLFMVIMTITARFISIKLMP